VVPILLLKLTLTPLLIGGATLVARRWGPAIGGWVVSLPLTSGPVLFFLALDHGPAFAAETTTGTLLGLGAIAGFCVGYLAGSRRGPLPAMAAAAAAYVLVALAVQPIAGAPFLVLAALVGAAIAGVLRVLPATAGSTVPREHPRWDLPARVIIGTAIVVGLTSIAASLGPVASGIVATFPVYVSVLAVFEHLHAGRLPALGVLRGLLLGLFGTIAFYIVLHALLVPAGIAVAFSAAIAVTLAVASVSLRRVRAGVDTTEPEPA
jgi:hypothetical protein